MRLLRRALRAPSAALLLPLLAVPAAADFDYPDFSSVAGLNLVGAAAQAGNVLRLTPSQPNQAGGAWHQTPQQVDDGFDTTFTFQLSPGGADGFTFTVQNSSATALGAAGCGLGYEGVPQSLAVELDTYSNTTCNGTPTMDPPGLHVSVHSLGPFPNSASESAALISTVNVPDFGDGGAHTARVRYQSGLFLVYVDDLAVPVLSVAFDLGLLIDLDQGRGWVGFSAGTGGLTSVHDLQSWSFSETPTGGGNLPPFAPTITEPVSDGLTLNPADVHMETTPFSDPDPGDQHACTDWEIWTQFPSERVWSGLCVTGPESIHAHLGDGAFEGSHFGRTELLPTTAYRLRVRHSDDSGDPGTQWSAWTERTFQTGDSATVYPLELEDVSDAPVPRWTRASDGADVILPPAATPSRLLLESGNSAMLLAIVANDGVTNTQIDSGPLPVHVPVRVQVRGGSTGLTLPETDLSFVDDDCAVHTVLLPPVSLAPNASVFFWISSAGATYPGTPAQTDPVFGTLLRGLTPPWDTRQEGFEVEVFAEDLQLPVNVAFVPNAGDQPGDPFLYVTELYGKVRVVTRDGTVSDYATNLLNFNPTGNFPGSGEQGVAGLAVDPVTGDVFASMLYASASNPSIHYPKVVRFTSTDGGYTAANQTTILDMAGEAQGQSHQVSNLTILPDGTLLCHMGDGFNAGTAQNIDSFRGKVLRMNLDGTPVPSNPLYDPNDGINSRDYIWVYGVRNPFGGDWRAADGFQYEVENGPSVDRLAKLVPDTNYGWNGTDISMGNHAIYNWIPAHGPVNIAFVQPESFGGSGFPQSSWDHAFVSESGPTYATGPQERGKRITEWIFDLAGDLVSGPIPFLEYAGTGHATVVGLEAGPDGLYFTDLYKDEGNLPIASGARILRVVYALDDCNGNGVDDACDIATGTSLDADADWVPDECACGGTSFCQVNPNSTGAPALISASGSCAVADNAFVLSAAPVPDQPGIFYYGANQVNGGMGMPFQDGFRCVGNGPVYRLPPVNGAGNVASFAVDFDSLSPAGAISPGETWHFQYWFRDPAAGGAGANFSDGLTVTFQ